MENNYRVLGLNKDFVTVIHSIEQGDFGKCYSNSEIERRELIQEVPETVAAEILNKWGGSPTIQPHRPDREDVRSANLADISAACNQNITSGFDLALTNGRIRHFSLQETDQINISAALMAVQQGAQGYPYHADNEVCSLFSGEDIVKLAAAATQHKLYHTTYGNHLLTWVRRAETAEELEGIYYGAALPEDLAANMQAVMAAMEAGNVV